MRTLEDIVKERAKKYRSFYKALYSVYIDAQKGKLKLIDVNPPRSMVEYLLRLDYSLWFWTIIALVIATLVSIKLSTIVPQLMPLRYILGTIYVIFIPGYVLIETLYPEEKSLTPLERLALSIGLSLAVVPLIGLLLNYTPWGIRLEPILITLSAYDIVLSLIAAYRKYVIVSIISSSTDKAI